MEGGAAITDSTTPQAYFSPQTTALNCLTVEIGRKNSYKRKITLAGQTAHIESIMNSMVLVQ